MVSGVLQWVYFTIGLMVPEPTLCYFLISGIDVLSSCQNPRIGSMTYGVRAIMVGKATCKPFQLPLSTKIVNQSNAAFPEGL